MKDRYLFRGISQFTDLFITGALSVDLEGDYFIDEQIVYENTIGQCTGLKDKNGTLIFEGDIVEFLSGEDNYGKWLATYGRPFIKFGNYLSDGRCHCESGYEAECEDCGDFASEEYGFHLFFSVAEITVSFPNSEAERCLVVGNIHDNPELLKSDA